MSNMREPVLEMYLFECNQLIEQFEQAILKSEHTGGMDSSTINEIFRIMHTIKGSSSMMSFHGIASLAHALEDLFSFIRSEQLDDLDYNKLADLALIACDCIKTELAAIDLGSASSSDTSPLVNQIQTFLNELLQIKTATVASINHPEQTPALYKVTVFFDEDCGMENVRAFNIVHQLKELTYQLQHDPEHILEEQSAELIGKSGFTLRFQSMLLPGELHAFFEGIPFLRLVQLDQIQQSSIPDPINDHSYDTLEETKAHEISPSAHSATQAAQSMISVNVSKLDTLLNLVGELVISEAMVTQSPDLSGLHLEHFHKAAQQLKKITNELQDVVMSLRMVSLSATFQRMRRIVRDMSQHLHKDVQLELIGAETEVDKNIIEHLTDPLMHLIRNAIDHGIENTADRIASGKPTAGKITLEAKNAGSEVWILVKDDGKGLDKETIVSKAKAKGLLPKAEADMSERDIFNCVFIPGFSTKESVSEYSGRGVGMDVVAKNIQAVGGTVALDSTLGRGTTIAVKIPLTLAIIDGMTIRVGPSRYTLPTASIKQSLKVLPEQIIIEPGGGENIFFRNECCPLIRLHERFGVHTEITEITDGIIIAVEHDTRTFCLLADELIGKQQVVVKSLPSYIKKVKGIAGCTLLGDGGISLILDTSQLLEYRQGGS